LKKLSDGSRLLRDWVLTFLELGEGHLGLLVSSYFSVSKMLSCHQHATRWSTHWCAAVVLCKSHSLDSKTIDVGSWDFTLTVTSELSPAKIVGKDENDVDSLSGWTRDTTEQESN
jgi:hypothetical protein